MKIQSEISKFCTLKHTRTPTSVKPAFFKKQAFDLREQILKKFGCFKVNSIPYPVLIYI